ncbi:GPP34 family phosphoprotein [Streptosporangium sp. G11]|uniref:GPP34 family phosphoprotein n=1 Tax=Streptosporangium sp. G11 TaxID=3436926 RepID=UPI003EB76014
MTQQPEQPFVGGKAETPDEAKRLGAPTLAEDLLLLLFQPGTGTIAGENTLFCTLAGAVLADFGLGDHVRTGSGRGGTTRVRAVEDHPPSDDILRSTWDYLSEKPRGVQTVLAAIGRTRNLSLVSPRSRHCSREAGRFPGSTPRSHGSPP